MSKCPECNNDEPTPGCSECWANHSDLSKDTTAFRAFVDGVNNNWDVIDYEFAKLWRIIYLVMLAVGAWGLILILFVMLVK